MDDALIVPVFVILDTIMEHFDHHSHVLAHVPDSEILTVAVIAAHSFGNHHELALQVLTKCGYLSGTISVSRFNRRLHALADWLELLIHTLAELALQGDAFVIDSMPMPVCVVCEHGAVARCADASTVGTVSSYQYGFWTLQNPRKASKRRSGAGKKAHILPS